MSAGIDGVQINVQHPDTLAVAQATCVGIFQGGTLIPPVKVAGGTLLGCFLLSGDVKDTSGGVVQFQLTRVGDFTSDQEITLGLAGAAATQFSDGGNSVSPGFTGALMVRP